ncbi:hypothetical protein [Pseudofrankia asymbiotica]|nr:hypothetical protein [Pseudofrankia asymbiotica]
MLTRPAMSTASFLLTNRMPAAASVAVAAAASELPTVAPIVC